MLVLNNVGICFDVPWREDAVVGFVDLCLFTIVFVEITFGFFCFIYLKSLVNRFVLLKK